MAAPAVADADQCAPPGVDSASAAARPTSPLPPPGPARTSTRRPPSRRWTASTPTRWVSARQACSPSARCRTRRRASASTRKGQFTGFDNELLRAVADKLGLRDQLRRHRLLRPARTGGVASLRRRLVVDHHHRCAAATVGFTNGYDFGYFSLVVPTGSPITGFDKLAAGQRIGVVQGTVQEAYVVDTLEPGPGEVPRLQHRLRQPEDPADRRMGGAVAAGAGHRASRAIPTEIIENTFSLDNFVAYAVAKENKPLIDALNSGLDAVIADGTWSRLYSDWVPRALPPGWKPGSKAAPVPQLPDFAAIAASHQGEHADSSASQPKSTLSQLTDSFLDWDLYKQAIPDLFKTGPAEHADPDRQRQRDRPAARHGAGRRGHLPVPLAALARPGLHRHLPRPARSGDHPADRPRRRADRRRPHRQQPLPARHRGARA